jgi:hypothetical protein
MQDERVLTQMLHECWEKCQRVKTPMHPRIRTSAHPHIRTSASAHHTSLKVWHTKHKTLPRKIRTRTAMQSATSRNSTMPSLLLDGEPPPMFALACVRGLRWMVQKNMLVKKIHSADQQPPVAHLNFPRDYESNCDATSDEVQA